MEIYTWVLYLIVIFSYLTYNHCNAFVQLTCESRTCKDQGCELILLRSDCQGGHYIHATQWPGQPRGLFLFRSTELFGFLVNMWFSLPEDVSATFVQGFQVMVDLSGVDIMGVRQCYLINMTTPVTMADINKPFSLRCLVDSRASFITVHVNSLPHRRVGSRMSVNRSLALRENTPQSPQGCHTKPNITKYLHHPFANDLTVEAHDKPDDLAYTMQLIFWDPNKKVSFAEIIMTKGKNLVSFHNVTPKHTFKVRIKYAGCDVVFTIAPFFFDSLPVTNSTLSPHSTTLQNTETGSSDWVVVVAIVCPILLVVVVTLAVFCVWHRRQAHAGVPGSCIQRLREKFCNVNDVSRDNNYQSNAYDLISLPASSNKASPLCVDIGNEDGKPLNAVSPSSSISSQSQDVPSSRDIAVGRSSSYDNNDARETEQRSLPTETIPEVTAAGEGRENSHVVWGDVCPRGTKNRGAEECSPQTSDGFYGRPSGESDHACGERHRGVAQVGYSDDDRVIEMAREDVASFEPCSRIQVHVIDGELVEMPVHVRPLMLELPGNLPGHLADARTMIHDPGLSQEESSGMSGVETWDTDSL